MGVFRSNFSFTVNAPQWLIQLGAILWQDEKLTEHNTKEGGKWRIIQQMLECLFLDGVM